MSAPRIFIDGEAGTTGLELAKWIAPRKDIELLSIDHELRKDRTERSRLLKEADLAILCLPDDAAREAVQLLDDEDTILIDASSAHRTDPDWVYGLPELSPDHRIAISNSKRISNPGCYASAAITLLRPLVSSNLAPADYVVSINAISGYSGGGREMIDRYDSRRNVECYRAYGLSMQHKHLPEIQKHSGLEHPPLFSPGVGDYYQGMLVEIMLSQNSLGNSFTRQTVHELLDSAYANERFVHVRSLEECDEISFLDPEGMNGFNDIELFVFGNTENVRLVARLDNLIKGASGVAIQNMNLALGFAEAEGIG